MKDDLKDAFPEEEVSVEDQTYSLGIVYQYLIEGLVPVLSVFAEEYTRLYKDELTQQPLCKDDSRTLKAFGLKLKVLVAYCPNVGYLLHYSFYYLAVLSDW